MFLSTTCVTFQNVKPVGSWLVRRLWKNWKTQGMETSTLRCFFLKAYLRKRFSKNKICSKLCRVLFFLSQKFRLLYS